MSDTSLVTNTTCLHVSNIDVSVKWYVDAFGVSVLHRRSTDSYESAFVALDSKGHPNAGAPVSQRDGVIELRQLVGSSAKGVKIYNGNTDPYKGFGHLCFALSNIEEAQKHLLEQGVEFKKRLEDGRQKNIAFVLDPDQYWVELIEDAIDKKAGVYNIASNRMNHTMVRIRDPARSLEFYRGILGMKLFSKREFPEAKFTLYFIGYDHSSGYTEGLEQPVEQAGRQSIIELTHNWGTETASLAEFPGYYVFGDDPAVAGFDHFSVSCKDSGRFIEELEHKKVIFMSCDKDAGTATIADPDGWRVEIHSYDYLK